MIRAAADAMFGMAEAILRGVESVWVSLAGSMQAVYDGLAASGLSEPNVALEAALTKQRRLDAEARIWAREAERAPQWRMVPDVIEISGQFINLPDGADLAHWSAISDKQGRPDDWIAQGTSFYTMRTTGEEIPYSEMSELEAATLRARALSPGYYDGGTIQALPDAEPSVTVRCQYCGVGGQDPDAGTCGRCGGPFPEVPRRLGSIIWPEAPLPGYVTR